MAQHLTLVSRGVQAKSALFLSAESYTGGLYNMFFMHLDLGRHFQALFRWIACDTHLYSTFMFVSKLWWQL